MDDFEWNVTNEGQLLDAMVGHKPVGINKYFQMACIVDKLAESLNCEIQSEKIWQHLETMYNLEALDDIETLPFPNDVTDFNLPDSEFAALKSKKEEKVDERRSISKGRETPKMKEAKLKEDKQPARAVKETQRRDSKDSKDGKQTPTGKKEVKKEPEKGKGAKGRNSLSESKSKGTPKEELPRSAKRPTRGNQKADDSGSNGKASPLTVTPGSSKRRRI